METFLNSNPGLKSRFNKFIQFEDYSPNELLEIVVNTAKKQDYKLTDGAKSRVLSHYVEVCANKPANFANARDARNLLEKAISNQAGRLVALGDVDEEMLMTITEDDLSL